MLLSGLVHGYFESHLNSWDALAGLLLIEDAGVECLTFFENDGFIEWNPVWQQFTVVAGI